MSLLILLLGAPALSYAFPQHASLGRRASVPAIGFINPIENGGSWLTSNTGGDGGEPLNVVISAYSDSAVLINQDANGGLLNFVESFGFSTECLGQHEGAPQTADLGDGDGYANQTEELREDYNNPEVGTCTETLEGGNHFRVFYQNGSENDSGAMFLAVSYEEPLSTGHNIAPNGYNLGRDWLVGNVTSQQSLINTATVTNGSTFSGSTEFGNYTYQTTATYYSGYLQSTSIGINHNTTVPVNGSNAIDGLIVVLDVKIVGSPATSGASRIVHSALTWALPALLVVATLHPIASLYI